MCVNLRITLVRFITVSSSTRTVSKHQEIIINYGYLIVNHFITHLLVTFQPSGLQSFQAQESKALRISHIR